MIKQAIPAIALLILVSSCLKAKTIVVNTSNTQDTTHNTLIRELFRIDEDDQKYRAQIEDLVKKYGWDAKEAKAIWKLQETIDSINLVKVAAILDKHGWLGVDAIGDQCNATLFMVIQHSDKATREKYLPMMREAVKNGKAAAKDLAYLEDRAALEHGKKQTYGSQLSIDSKTNMYYVSPLEDPDHVDKRRAEVGLKPLAEYLGNCCQIKWDPEQYKKDLPALEAKEKAVLVKGKNTK